MVVDDSWHKQKNIDSIVQKAVTIALETLNFSHIESELSIVLSNDEEIRKINAQWRQKDQATNVLSFPAFPLEVGQTPSIMLGDIILARETILNEAAEEKKTFEHHLTHMIVHGLLHLLGYDHETDAEAEEMEKLEREILYRLAIDDPYAVLL